MANEERETGSVRAREFDRGNRRSAPAQEGDNLHAQVHSGAELAADLRSMDGGSPSGSTSRDATAGSSPPPGLPGWRFVDQGAALAFSDGHSWKRTIVLPTILDEGPDRRVRRTLGVFGGLRRRRPKARESLDELRRLLLLLVAMTEYRESLYRAAVHDFKVPLIVQRDVQLELRPKGNRSLSDDLRVIDRGLLRVSLDSFSFAGSRGVHTAGSGTVTSIQEDIGLGRVSVNPSGTEPWHLLGVSPVGVFAAASAARMTVEESRRYRANPQKVATDLLDPDDPTLLIPGDDRVLDLEGICRELSASPGWRGRLHSR